MKEKKLEDLAKEVSESMAKGQTPLFVIETGVILELIEDKNTKEPVSKMVTMINELKNKDVDFKCVTPMSSFLNAIWKCDENIPISNLKDLMEILTILPEFEKVDFKNDELVKKSLIDSAKTLSQAEEISNLMKEKFRDIMREK